MFSAKGAMSALACGQRPRNSIGPDSQALKARFTSATLSRAYSASQSRINYFPGALPQAEGDVAPLAQASTAFAFRMREYFDAVFNQQALLQRSRPARRALVAAVP